MVFKNLCFLVLWAKGALALGGLSMQLCLQEWCRALGCGSDATETPTEESGWCRTQSHCRFFFLQTRKTGKEMCYSIDKVVYLFAHNLTVGLLLTNQEN